MRLVSFGAPGAERPGVLDDHDHVVPLDPLLRRLGLGHAGVCSILALWESLAAPIGHEVATSDERLPLPGVRLGPPVPRPPGIFGIGKNYGEAPGRKPGADTAELSYLHAPPIFMKPVGTLAGHRDPVRLPTTSTAVDYELEVAIVIGREGRAITREDAGRHIAGYLLANDITACDLMRSQVFVGKGFDSFLPCGPWVLTADSVTLDAIKLELSVNGEPRQAGKATEMRLDPPAIVELISAFTTLHAGDLILTGTPAGSGAGMDPPRFLTAGDTITASGGPLGALDNRVQAG